MTDHEMSPSVIASYLRDHPDFFDTHPELLPPAPSPSLTLQQLQRQRQQLETQKAEIAWMAENAAANQAISETVHQFQLHLTYEVVNDLPAAASPLSLTAVEELICKTFDLEQVAIFPFRQLSRLASPSTLELEERYSYLRNPYCAQRNNATPPGLEALLAPAIASFALVPVLEGRSVLALLLCGDDDGNRFVPEQGTHFLEQVANALLPILKYLEQRQ